METVFTPREEEIDQLKREISALGESLIAAQKFHKQDIETISKKLIEAAHNHAMCSEFDEWIEETNRYLIIPLEERIKEFNLSVHIQASVSRQVSIKVKAGSLDAAISMVEDDPEGNGIDFEDLLLSDRWDVSIENEEVTSIEED